MAHFAHVNQEDIVCSVIVIEQDVIDSHNGWPCPHCNTHVAPADWVQTSYHAKNGVYKGEDKNAGSTEDINARNRRNFAAVGYEYHQADDMFVPPKPFASWILDKVNGTYVAPKQKPEIVKGESVAWDESKGDWVITKKVITP